jgi:hypothetical protein
VRELVGEFEWLRGARLPIAQRHTIAAGLPANSRIYAAGARLAHHFAAGHGVARRHRAMSCGPRPGAWQELADYLLRTFLEQMLQDVFHADPHPGNVMLLTDGRLADRLRRRRPPRPWGAGGDP